MPDKKASNNDYQQFYNAFRNWAISQYGFWRVFSDPLFTYNQFQNSPYYNDWITAGAPGWGTEAERIKQRQAEWATQLRKSTSASGRIPLVGNEDKQKYLESLGHKLVTSDQWGDLPPEEQYFEKPKTPEPGAPTDEVYKSSSVTYSPSLNKWYITNKNGKFEASEQDALKTMSNDILSEWQVSQGEQSKLDLVNAQLNKTPDWQAQLQLEQQKQESARLQKLLNPQLFSSNKLSQAEKAEIVENVRKAILSTATGPADWIIRAQAQTYINPYLPQPVSEAEEAYTQADRLNAEANYWQNLADTGSSDTVVGNTYVGEGGVKALAQQFADYARQNSAMLSARAAGMSNEVPSSPEQGFVSVPDWLPQFAPNQRAGARLTKEQIPTPSLQLLAKTPWSIREGVRGYTQWAGGTPYDDLLERAKMMAPQNPRGGGSVRWRPV